MAWALYRFFRQSVRKAAIIAGLWKPRPFIAILAVGQSNMEGCHGPVSPTLLAPDERVKIWHLYARKWMLARLGWRPFRVAAEGPANNLAFVFARRLAKQRDAIVRMVLLARGGLPIEAFLPGGEMADDLLSDDGHARTALRSIGKPAYDILLIHQGEANFTDPGFESAEDYAAKLRDLLARMTAAGLINRKTKIALGEISSGYRGAGEHARALRMLQDRCAVVPWAGVETVGAREGSGDQHATGDGLQLLGERYLHAYERVDRSSRVATRWPAFPFPSAWARRRT